MCKEWMKKDSLEKFWNDVQLEEENSWMQEVTIGIREKGINYLECIDREEWRRKITLKL